ncbi:MAG: sigma-54-dependent transcriptional regulator [Planctomycetota bacterium]
MSDGDAGRLLVVDDDESMRTMLQIVLQRDGHEVDLAPDGPAALKRVAAAQYDLVLQDVKMPGMNGIELLQRLKEHDPRILVVLITAFSTWDTAVDAMRLGAYSYIRKPFDNDEVRALVHRALAQKRLHADAAEAGIETAPKLIGSTPEMQEIFSLIKRVAPTDSTVVVQGESGSGKELIARLLHLYSLRAQNPLITVNCGAFSETLLESELFGHVRGAFTGAVTDKRGLLEVADGGTFFLDELGEMPPQTQVRFLRLLENREFLPVGGTEPRKADVRFLTATNRDLEAMVEDGSFREDLFYRLNVISIRVPPLRERREDIPLLAGHFLAVHAARQGKNVVGFDEDAMAYMADQDWPGNIRELENTIQRAVTLTETDSIGRDAVAANRPRMGSRASTRSAAPAAPVGGAAPDGFPEGFSLEAHLAGIEKDCIAKALAAADGNMTRAAELLGISFRQIRYKVKKLGL